MSTVLARAKQRAAAPPAGPELAGRRALRRWKVLHACAAAAPVALLMEAQLDAGMAPSLLAAEAGALAGRRGLLNAWSDVKHWKTQLAAKAAGVDLVHAHEFACGMAALRAGIPVAYDFGAPVEDSQGGRFVAGAWLRRSMRAAEQFLLARAGAVVVHSHSMWDRAVERGVGVEDLFLVPEPVAVWPGSGNREHGSETRATQPPATQAVCLYAPGIAVQPQGISPELRTLLEAFAFVREELESARLYLEVESGAEAVLRELLSVTPCAESLDVITPLQRSRAIADADVVISAAPLGEGPDAVALQALARGCALLAADRPQTREVSSEGRGCLWFRRGDGRDLGHRMAFLARNSDFRAALGSAGQAHIAATRGGRAVAEMYDAVYRHAFARHPGPGDFLPARLRMAQVCV